MENEQFEEIQSDEVLNQRLQQLGREAQQHPPLSVARQVALNKLVKEIWQSGQLGHPQRGSWSPSLYEDLYNEALQKTLMEICQKIDNYNPEYPVMMWVNTILKRRFIDVVRDYKKRGRTYIPETEKNQETSNLLSLDDLDKEVPVDEELSEGQQVRQFLKDDPENLFRTEHIRGRPDATFQKITWARFVEDKKWEAISAELGIPVPTLSSFFQRRLPKFIPYFQKYLQE